MKNFKFKWLLLSIILSIVSINTAWATKTAIPANTIIYVDITNFHDDSHTENNATDSKYYISQPNYYNVTENRSTSATSTDGAGSYWPKGDSTWLELSVVSGNIYCAKTTDKWYDGNISFWTKNESIYGNVYEACVALLQEYDGTNNLYTISSGSNYHDVRHATCFGTDVSVMPTFKAGRTLYLNADTYWDVDKAIFRAYFFNGVDNTWATCTQVGSTHYYSVTVPDGSWTHVIFVRKNPANPDGSWTGKWNQTSDMAPSGMNNCVNITASGDNNQSWGDYAPTPAIAGSMNNWAPDANVMSDGSVGIELDGGKAYAFQIVNGTTWYGSPDSQYKITCVGQDQTFNPTPSDKHILLLTAGDGIYTFHWDGTDLTIDYPDVTHPSTDYVYFKDNEGWHKSYFTTHLWGGTTGTTWETLPVLTAFNFDGIDYYYTALGGNTTGLVSKGSTSSDDEKTADLSLSSHMGQWYNVVDKSTQSSEVAANWKDFTATLTLSTDQGETTDPSPITVTVTYGKSTNINTDVLSTSPAHDTYTFGGYYTEPGGAGTQVINASEKIPSDLSGYTSSGNWIKTGSSVSATLYAKWTCTITLNNQGADTGKGGTSSVTATYNSSTGLTTISKPQKTGYVFCGYYTLAYGSGKQIIDENGDFNSSVTDYITTGTWTYSSGNVTLYAYWKKASSADQYTFRYYQNGAVAYQVQSFVGDGNERTISNFTIPTTEDRFFVGYNEDFWSSGLGEGETKTSSAVMDWTTAYAETAGVGNGAMKLLPGSSAVGLASGAVGTLKIWTEDAHKNLSVGFLPSGYGLTYATGTIAFNTWEETNFCETDVVTLTSSDASGTFQVKLAASSGYVACGHGTAEAASAVNGRKITGDADIANGKKGVFQIWQDASANNFGLRFVTVHDVSFNMQDHGSAISDYTDIRYNSKISAPSNPSAAGYTFGGWYKEQACTNEWDFENDVVTEATTLYAKWTANTLTFNGSVASHETEWNNTGNWSEAIVPTIDHPVIISKPVTVNTNAAKAKSITFSGTGTLTIPATGALEVTGTITNTDASKIVINSTTTNQGALIFNSTGSTAATVNMTMNPDAGKFQFVAIPVSYVDVSAAFEGKGVYTYVWKNSVHDWEQRGYYDGISSYEAVIAKGIGSTSFSGNLVNTNDFSSGSLSYNSSGYGDVYMFGNSWTAPIKKSAMTLSGISSVNILLKNNSWDGVISDDIIPALQGYAVVVGSEGGSVTVDYDDAVRGVASESRTSPLKAPQRFADEEPEPITVYVSGNEMRTRIRLFEDEARFSEELDEGWEAYYMEGEGYAGDLYAMGPERKMNVLATSNLEGTVVGFVPGQAENYTISFAGDGKGYYLNDVKEEEATLIEEGNTYEFTSDESTNSTRFVISKTPIAKTPTSVENISDSSKARKQMIDGTLYIIRDGRIYNAEGSLVK